MGKLRINVIGVWTATGLPFTIYVPNTYQIHYSIRTIYVHNISTWWKNKSAASIGERMDTHLCKEKFFFDRNELRPG